MDLDERRVATIVEHAIVASLRDITKLYSGRPVVDGVSLDVRSGRITMLVGPNGCGKTTSMEILVGLRRPSSGHAEVCGVAVRPGGRHRLLVGVQLQRSGLPARVKVGEALVAAASLYDEPADARDLAEALGLTEHWNAMVDKLSGGLRRRLDIAVACVGRAPFLMLDEPTSGVDPQGRAEVWHFLRALSRSGVGVLASTHDLTEAEAFADDLLVMSDGHIILSGTPEEVTASVGGQWRLRLADTGPVARDIVERSGLVHAQLPGGLLVVGDEPELSSLRERLGVALAAAAESPPDVLSGRVRLEDVYVLAGRRAEADQEGHR